MRWIGGSDANVILSGNTDRIRELWLEKRGEVNPKDLSSNLAVMLGCWTEPFNRQWFEVITGRRVSRAGDCLSCDRYSWRRCTLDGFVEEEGAIWEAKHTNALLCASRRSSLGALQRARPDLYAKVGEAIAANVAKLQRPSESNSVDKRAIRKRKGGTRAVRQTAKAA